MREYSGLQLTFYYLKKINKYLNQLSLNNTNKKNTTAAGQLVPVTKLFPGTISGNNLKGRKLLPKLIVNTGKNVFVTVTKLGTTNNFFVAATKNFAAATKRFVDRTKRFVVVTKYFCYPYFDK